MCCVRHCQRARGLPHSCRARPSVLKLPLSTGVTRTRQQAARRNRSCRRCRRPLMGAAMHAVPCVLALMVDKERRAAARAPRR